MKLVPRIRWNVHRLARAHRGFLAPKRHLNLAVKHNKGLVKIVPMRTRPTTRRHVHIDHAESVASILSRYRDRIRVPPTSPICVAFASSTCVIASAHRLKSSAGIAASFDFSSVMLSPSIQISAPSRPAVTPRPHIARRSPAPSTPPPCHPAFPESQCASSPSSPPLRANASLLEVTQSHPHGRISSAGPPHRCALPHPAITISVCPSGCGCHAVRAPPAGTTGPLRHHHPRWFRRLK